VVAANAGCGPGLKVRGIRVGGADLISDQPGEAAAFGRKYRHTWGAKKKNRRGGAKKYTGARVHFATSQKEQKATISSSKKVTREMRESR